MELLCSRCGRYAAPQDYLCDQHRAEVEALLVTEWLPAPTPEEAT
jgi:hypothetical protein